MAGNESKKAAITCDYCNTSTEASQIYTARKVFAGRKVQEILQLVSQCPKIPITVGIKLCNICMSTFLYTTTVVEKVKQLVVNNLENIGKGKRQGEESLAEEQQKELQLNGTIPNDPNGVTKKQKENSLPKTKISKAKPKKQAVSGDNSSSGLTELQEPELASFRALNGDGDNGNLENAIKLTPSGITKRRNSQFLNLFGASAAATGNESDSEDYNKANNKSTATAKSPYKHNNFECKLCEFIGKTPKIIKEHLKSEHKQMRPRIYDCDKCPKSFGLLKTLKEHVKTHVDGETDQAANDAEENITQDVDVSVFKTKLFEKDRNTEYTFAVEKTETSTPKPLKENVTKIEKKRLVFECEICDSSLKTIKNMKEHMKVAHNMDNPKLFRCDECKKGFESNQYLKRHIETLHKKQKNQSTVDKKPTVSPKKKIIKNQEKKASPRKVSENAANNEDLLISKAKSPRKALQNLAKVKESSSLTSVTSKSPRKVSESIVIVEDTLIAEPTPKAVENIARAKASDLHASVTAKSPRKVSESIEIFDENHLQSSQKRKRKESLLIPEDMEISMTQASPSPTKKSKSRLSSSICELGDGINLDVVPHKRELINSDMDDSSFSCSKCEKIVTSEKRLKMHIQKRHAKCLKCRTCKKRWESSLEYVQHFGTICQPTNDDSGLPCGVPGCEKIFQGANYLTSHLQKKHQL